MNSHGLKNIPVVDEVSRPIGVLDARDALELLREKVEYEELLLRDFALGSDRRALG